MTRRGFTILELLIVVGLVALMGAIAIPLLFASKPGDRLREATHALVADVQLARAIAVTGSLPSPDPAFQSVDFVDVTFDSANELYRVEAINKTAGAETRKLIKEVRLPQTPAVRIDLDASSDVLRFRGNGSADRRIELSLYEPNVNLTQKVDITRAGLARIQ